MFLSILSFIVYSIILLSIGGLMKIANIQSMKDDYIFYKPDKYDKLVGVNVVDVYYQLLEEGISYPKLLKECINLMRTIEIGLLQLKESLPLTF